MQWRNLDRLAPGRVEAIRAFKWLTVHPPTAVTVRATRDGDGPDPATGETTVKASIDKHARATVVVAPDYPEPPQPQATAVHGEIACPCTPETLYEERHLFHGPAYQGLLTFDEFGEDGASGLLETKDFPGSLLDNAGQLFGFWLAQRVDKDRLVLPTMAELGVKEMEFASWSGLLAPKGTPREVAYRRLRSHELADLATIHGFLTTSYWSPGVPRATVEKAIAGSLCIGAFRGEAQIGFARLVTDRATFAYTFDRFAELVDGLREMRESKTTTGLFVRFGGRLGFARAHEIGRILGVSRQVLHRRFRQRPPD